MKFLAFSFFLSLFFFLFFFFSTFLLATADIYERI